MRVVFLGTGTSAGVPVVGCGCSVCRSNDPKNDRTRSSIYVETGNRSLVVDTPTDFRRQLLREDITTLDFILFTHAHADHVMGLDDVRPLNVLMEKSIACYGKPECLDKIRRKFEYIFKPTRNQSWKPRVTLHPLEEPRSIQGVRVEPLPVNHGNLSIYGYRIGDLAYVCDVSRIPDGTLERLEDVRWLILDALRFRPHPTHMTVDEALETARRIEPDVTYLTHIAHEVNHEPTDRSLPDGIHLAYDGLTLNLTEDGTDG